MIFTEEELSNRKFLLNFKKSKNLNKSNTRGS